MCFAWVGVPSVCSLRLVCLHSPAHSRRAARPAYWRNLLLNVCCCHVASANPTEYVGFRATSCATLYIGGAFGPCCVIVGTASLVAAECEQGALTSRRAAMSVFAHVEASGIDWVGRAATCQINKRYVRNRGSHVCSVVVVVPHISVEQRGSLDGGSSPRFRDGPYLSSCRLGEHASQIEVHCKQPLGQPTWSILTTAFLQVDFANLEMALMAPAAAMGRIACGTGRVAIGHRVVVAMVIHTWFHT